MNTLETALENSVILDVLYDSPAERKAFVKGFQVAKHLYYAHMIGSKGLIDRGPGFQKTWSKDAEKAFDEQLKIAIDILCEPAEKTHEQTQQIP